MKKSKILLAMMVLVILAMALSGCGKKNPDEEEEPAVVVVGLPRNAIVQNAESNTPEPVVNLEGALLVAVVMADEVNVRQAATSQSTSLGRVNTGDMLQVLSAEPTVSGSDSWYAVRYNNQNAFIHGDFISTETMDAETRVLVGIVVNVESYLNIRQAASADSERIGRVQNGDKLRILERDAGSGWTRVQYESAGSSSSAGYVFTEYLNIQEYALADLLL